MTSDPARAALIRYLGGCIRAEQRALTLLTARQARTRAAKQQIVDFDRQQVKTLEQMQAGARAAKRRRSVKVRAA